MQEDLTALQPKLIQTSKETAELIEIIKEETKEVDAKRQLIAADEKMANDAAEEAKAIKVWILFSFVCLFVFYYPIEINKETKEVDTKRQLITADEKNSNNAAKEVKLMLSW